MTSSWSPTRSKDLGRLHTQWLMKSS